MPKEASMAKRDKYKGCSLVEFRRGFVHGRNKQGERSLVLRVQCERDCEFEIDVMNEMGPKGKCATATHFVLKFFGLFDTPAKDLRIGFCPANVTGYSFLVRSTDVPGKMELVEAVMPTSHLTTKWLDAFAAGAKKKAKRVE